MKNFRDKQLKNKSPSNGEYFKMKEGKEDVDCTDYAIAWPFWVGSKAQTTEKG